MPPLAISTKMSTTSSTSSGSSALVGSSHNKTFGLIANALAIATRCCCPPDNPLGNFSEWADKPTRFNKSEAICKDSSLDLPKTKFGPNATFSSADI